MAYPYRDQQYQPQQQWYSQNQHYQQAPFPVYRQQPQPLPYTYGSTQYPGSSSRSRDYLASLSTSVNSLSIGQPSLAKDKPLPRLPAADTRVETRPDGILDTRPYARPETGPDRRPIAGPSLRPDSLPTYGSSIPPLPTPPAIPPRPATQVQTPPEPARKSFVPSFHPHRSGSQVDLLRPPELPRPQSDSVLASSSKGKGKSPIKGREEIDLTIDSDEESPSSHRRRAISEITRTSPSKGSNPSIPRTPVKSSPIKPPASPLSPHAVRCSGYTRSGQPCKRVVKSTAPFLLSRDINFGPGDEQKEERYCKDHAGRICQVGGFYWRGAQKSVWVDFDGKPDPAEVMLMNRAYTDHVRPTDSDATSYYYGK
jgi:hypothetical protein